MSAALEPRETPTETVAELLAAIGDHLRWLATQVAHTPAEPGQPDQRPSLDLGDYTLEPAQVRAPRIGRPYATWPGWRVIRWDRTLSPVWGDDVDEVEVGEARSLEDAVRLVAADAAGRGGYR